MSIKLLRLVCFVIFGGLLLLSGCGPLLEQEAENPFDADFTVTIVSQGPMPTVAVQAGDQADEYRWEFYGADATQPPHVIEGGPSKRSVTYSWPSLGPGAYVVVLVAKRHGNGGGGGSGSGGKGGCCGPAPGPGGGSGGGGGSGEDLIATSFKVVKFAGCNNLVPILVFTTWDGGYVSDTFYPFQKVCVNALESIGENLTYRIEIVRVRSVNDPTPIPPDYPIPPDPSNPVTPPTPPPGVQYIITENPLYCFYIPGPSCCDCSMWTYRVTLRIRDKWWNEATLTKFIFVGCCP